MSNKTEKEKKLDKLDELVIDKMINILNGTEEQLEMSDLSTAVQYLKMNNITEDKKTDKDNQIEERIKRAEERRKRREKEKEASRNDDNMER